MRKIIRVLIGKVGLDSHERGAKYIATILRNAGMEVVYVPRFKTPQAIIDTAVQEDVDVIGLSFLSQEYLYYVPKIVEGLKKKNMEDIILILGGIIFDTDIPKMKAIGVQEVFTPGTTPQEVISFINSAVA